MSADVIFYSQDFSWDVGQDWLQSDSSWREDEAVYWLDVSRLRLMNEQDRLTYFEKLARKMARTFYGSLGQWTKEHEEEKEMIVPVGVWTEDRIGNRYCNVSITCRLEDKEITAENFKCWVVEQIIMAMRHVEQIIQDRNCNKLAIVVVGLWFTPPKD